MFSRNKKEDAGPRIVPCSECGVMVEHSCIQTVLGLGYMGNRDYCLAHKKPYQKVRLQHEWNDRGTAYKEVTRYYKEFEVDKQGRVIKAQK